MLAKGRIRIFLTLLVSIVFLFQSCATILRGTWQKIPVTSNPPGAKITLNGIEKGYTPLNLKLKRKWGYIIRIEKEGYYSCEIRPTRKTSGSLTTSIIGNAICGGIGALLGFGLIVALSEEDFEGISQGAVWTSSIIGAALGYGSAMYVDSSSDGFYILSPKELNVTLTKYGEKPKSNIILIDEEQFKNIKWIRIKCDDSEEQEIINLKYNT